MVPVRRITFLLILLVLTGCTPIWRSQNWFGMGSSRPVTGNGTPSRESWCYRTLGKIDCYPQPQNLPPSTLVSVDPPSRMPLTAGEHAQDVAKAQGADKAQK